MKFAVVILACVAAASAQFNQFPGQYNPGQYNPGRYNPNGFRGFSTPPPFRYQTVAPTKPPTYFVSTPAPAPARVVVPKVASNDANAETLRAGNDISPDGSYNYFYETSNGIAAQEQGTPRNLGGNPPVAPVVAQGSFSYTSPEGVPVVISYVADENGFQPSGDLLPVAPPVPEAILRSLEYIARNSGKN